MIATIGLSCLCMAANAQQHAADSALNRTVVVENQYNPEVMDAFKVNVLPKVEEPALPKQHIDYATALHPFSNWNFTPLQAMTSEEKQREVPRGYLRASYGSRNNVDARFSYLWDISRRDFLHVDASLYGMNGDVPSVITEADDWKSRFYRTDASLGYRHDFRKVSLALGGSFASQVFNYMPVWGIEDVDYSLSSHQRYTLGEGYLRVASVEGKLPVEFSFQTGLRSFSRAYDSPWMGSGSENIFHTEGLVSGNINERQRVGIGFAMDNLIHDVDQTDYTLLCINPHYTFGSKHIQLRAGMHVDMQFGHDGRLMLSPDVKFDFLFARSYRFYLQATGGTRLNDFRGLNEQSPYWIQAEQMQTSYTPVDVQAGVQGAPMPGLGFRLFGGYRVVKDEIFRLPGMLEEPYPYVYTFLAQDKAKVGYGGAWLAYQYKDWLDISAQGTYYGWDVKEDREVLLYLKPKFAFDASVRAKLYKDLWIKAQYRFEQRADMKEMETADDVNSLSLGAGYAFFGRLNVFVSLNNLLNRTYLAETGYPVQGFYATAGLSVRF